jgi:hypothetical protein
MRRIGGWGLGAFKDPGTDGKRAPRKTYGVSQTFGSLVGLCERMRRSDSDEKTELIECDMIQRYLTDLDIDFMIRWAKALFAMRPTGKTPVVVTTLDPRVTLELVATDAAMAQLHTVFNKLDESGSSQFVLIDAGKDVLEASRRRPVSSRPTRGSSTPAKPGARRSRTSPRRSSSRSPPPTSRLPTRRRSPRRRPLGEARSQGPAAHAPACL